MRPTKLTRTDHKEIIRLYRDDNRQGICVLARKFSVRSSTVKQILMNAGIELRPQGFEPIISTEEIVKLYETFNIKRIAKRLNINEKTVRARLVSAGIQLRNLSESGQLSERGPRGSYIDPIKAFWSKVNKNGSVPQANVKWTKAQRLDLRAWKWNGQKWVWQLGRCWTWTGGHHKDGRGFFTYLSNRKRVRETAPRFSYRQEYGNLPTNKPFVCHTCDNPSCIRPSHLFAGTSKDNVLDSVKKFRAAAGERNARSKLTNRQAKEIRELYAFGNVSQQELGDRFGVPQTAISRIVRKEAYIYTRKSQETTRENNRNFRNA